eukprot:UN2941
MQFQWANDFAKQYGPAAQDEEDHGWSSRFNALGFPVSDRQLCELGWNDRMKAHEWVQTRAAADAGVEHQHTAPLAYFETMAQYRQKVNRNLVMLSVIRRLLLGKARASSRTSSLRPSSCSRCRLCGALARSPCMMT